MNFDLPPATLGCTRTSEHTHHRDYYADVRGQEIWFGWFHADEYAELHESPQARAEFERDWGQPPTLRYFEDFEQQMRELEAQASQQEAMREIEEEDERLRMLGPAHPDYFDPMRKAILLHLDRHVGVPEGTNLGILVARLVAAAQAFGDPTGLPDEEQR